MLFLVSLERTKVKNMLLEVPFYANEEGEQCVQVVMKTMLKYFLDKEYSLTELDEMTGRKGDKWTWTSQAVLVLHKLGLDVKFYSKEELAPFLAGEAFIRQHYGKDADTILRFSDVSLLAASVKELLTTSVFEKRVLPWEEIEKAIQAGKIVWVCIDSNKLYGSPGGFQGHSVIITGFDDDNVYYHESGPNPTEPNKKVPKQAFVDAWNADGTDNDVVIATGKHCDRMHNISDILGEKIGKQAKRGNL